MPDGVGEQAAAAKSGAGPSGAAVEGEMPAATEGTPAGTSSGQRDSGEKPAEVLDEYAGIPPEHRERIAQRKRQAKEARLLAQQAKAAAAKGAQDAAAARTASDAAAKEANAARDAMGRAVAKRVRAELAAAAASKMKEGMLGAKRAANALDAATTMLEQEEKAESEAIASAVTKSAAAAEARKITEQAKQIAIASKAEEDACIEQRDAKEAEAERETQTAKVQHDITTKLTAEALTFQAEMEKAERAAKAAKGKGAAWESRTAQTLTKAKTAYEKTRAAAEKAEAASTTAGKLAEEANKALSSLLEDTARKAAKAAEDHSIMEESVWKYETATQEAEEAAAAADAAKKAVIAAREAKEAAVKLSDEKLLLQEAEQKAAKAAADEAENARATEAEASATAAEATALAAAAYEEMMAKATDSRTLISESEEKELAAVSALNAIKTAEEEGRLAEIRAAARAAEEAERAKIEEAERLKREAEEKAKRMLEDTMNAKRGQARSAPTMAKLCKLTGEGLQKAYIRQQATFLIEACGEEGVRQPDGGDAFFVCIRCKGKGTRIRSKVQDHGDGRYTVTYKPTTAGRCSISVSLMGDPVIGSPFPCTVHDGTPCAPQCELKGEALTQIVSSMPAAFFVTFRDVLGNLTHAVDLDVCVQRVGDLAPLELPDRGGERRGSLSRPSHDSIGTRPSHESMGSRPSHESMGLRAGAPAPAASLQPSTRPSRDEIHHLSHPQTIPRPVGHDRLIKESLIKPLDDFDRLVVGSKVLNVSRGPNPESERVAQLRPGRPIKLLKLETVSEEGKPDGTVRAFIALSDRDRRESWRDIYPQSPPWRLTLPRDFDVAPSPSGLDRDNHGVSVEVAHGDLDEVSEPGPPASQEPDEPPPLQQAVEGEELSEAQQGLAHDTAAEGKLAYDDKKSTKDDAASKPAGKEGKGTKGGKRPSRKRTDAKGESSQKAKDTKDSKDAKESKDAKVPPPASAQVLASAPAAATSLPLSALVPAAEKGRSSSPTNSSDTSKSSSKRGRSKGGRGKKGADQLHGLQPVAEESVLASSEVAPEHAINDEVHVPEPTRESSEAHGTEAASKELGKKKATDGTNNLGSATSSGRFSPNTQAYFSPRQPEHGWITVSTSGGKELVTKEVGRLPAHLRQQYMQEWERQQGVDSNRERERALTRDEEKQLEEDMARTLSSEISNGRPPRRIFSPYLQRLEADPKGICFAYGGVYPGRLHSKGKIHEAHQVHYSVGVCGRYLLHVSMRPSTSTPLTPLPGSPFVLDVIPGKANPLSTMIPPEELPLRGALELSGGGEEGEGRARCSCTLQLLARDKMGNRCRTGGAVVTAGCMDAGSLESSCVDQGNGAYTVRWWGAQPGTYTVFVKMDGLHVIGSPAVMHLTSGTPELSKTEIVADHIKKGVAGKPLKVRLNCKDSGNMPAVPGSNFTFGVTILAASETDPEAWRARPSENVERQVIGDQTELSFVPKLAGEVKAYLWAKIDDTERTRSPLPAGRRSSHEGSSTESKGRKNRRRANKSSYNAASDVRKLLPGAPLTLAITPSEVSVKNSYIDGILRSVYGAWEDVRDVLLAGKAKPSPGKEKKSPGKSDDGEEETEQQTELTVGDTIKIRPCICDQFDNAVGARNGSLTVHMHAPNGTEVIPVLAQAVRNSWSHDVTYELRAKGPYKLEVLLDETPVQGSPVEWSVRPRAAAVVIPSKSTPP